MTLDDGLIEIHWAAALVIQDYADWKSFLGSGILYYLPCKYLKLETALLSRSHKYKLFFIDLSRPLSKNCSPSKQNVAINAFRDNRTFYSCVFSDLAWDWKRGCGWPYFDTDLTAFHMGMQTSEHKNSMIYIWKAVRFVSKQGHL